MPLARECDVVVENWPGRLASGDWATMTCGARTAHRHASISGATEPTGRTRARAGFDNIAGSGFTIAERRRWSVWILGMIGNALLCHQGAGRAHDRDGHGISSTSPGWQACLGLMQGALPEFGATGKIRNVGQHPQYCGTEISTRLPTAGLDRRQRTRLSALHGLMGQPALADDPRFGP